MPFAAFLQEQRPAHSAALIPSCVLVQADALTSVRTVEGVTSRMENVGGFGPDPGSPVATAPGPCVPRAVRGQPNRRGVDRSEGAAKNPFGGSDQHRAGDPFSTPVTVWATGLTDLCGRKVAEGICLRTGSGERPAVFGQRLSAAGIGAGYVGVRRRGGGAPGL